MNNRKAVLAVVGLFAVAYAGVYFSAEPQVHSHNPVLFESQMAKLEQQSNTVERLIGRLDAVLKGLASARPEVAGGNRNKAQTQGGARPCGDVCDHSIRGAPGMFYETVRKNIQCDDIMHRMAKSKPATEWPPPKKPPAKLEKGYTMDGNIPVTDYWFAQRYDGTAALHSEWTPDMVDGYIKKFDDGGFIGGYGRASNDDIFKCATEYPVKGQRGAVIGSEWPWVEALMLRAGAKSVTTIEFGKIHSTDPRINTLVPTEVAERWGAGTFEPEQYDFIATHSSVEHTGLGRYGDALNPWGDLEAMAQVWCMLKPGGTLFIGVMTARTENPTTPETILKDRGSLEFNAHRIYGKLRYAQLTANFEQLAMCDTDGYNQPTIALRKLGNMAAPLS
jgi:hypothetical protein